MLNTTLSSHLRSSRGRRVRGDLIVAAVFACVIWTYSFSYDGSVAAGGRVVQASEGWELLFPAVTVLLVAVRRVAPWSVLLAFLAVDWFDRASEVSSEPFGVAVGLFTIASRRVWWQTTLAGAVAFAVLVASTQLIHRTTTGFWTCLIVYAFGLVAGVAAQRTEDARWRVMRLVAEARVERRATQRAEERAALALEVHDVCSSSLAVVSRLAEVARARVVSDPPAAQAMLDDVAKVARDGMVEVRRFVRLAESDPVDGDVAAMLARVRAVGVPVESTVVGEPRDPQVGVAVYRVLQEALTNVLRHARPTRVEVEVRYDADGRTTLLVVNDGVPGGVPAPGRGTRGMAERIAALGGALDSAPGLDDGTWRVEATVPPPGQPGGRVAPTAAVAR